MARVVNLHSMLTRMSGELSERLKNSALARWRGQLLIVGQEQRATLNIAAAGITVIPAERAKGRFKHAIRAGDQISQLLIGSASPKELLDLPAIRTAGDGAALAEALFPAQHPMLGFCDCF